MFRRMLSDGQNFDEDHPVVRRNAHWMESLLTLLEQRSLVCVGALHLVGLLNLLGKGGFSFNPVY